MTYVVKNWLEYQDSPTHAINVVCKTCGMDIQGSPVSFKHSLKPFLVIYTHSQQRVQYHRRTKRSVDCEPGVNECCRSKLYVDFADIGWDDWIIHPPGYNAYYCKGSCATAATLTLSATQHNSILHVSYWQRMNKARLIGLNYRCCYKSSTYCNQRSIVVADTNCFCRSRRRADSSNPPAAPGFK